MTILQGLIKQAKRCARPAPIVKCGRVVGIQIDDLTVVLNGTAVITLAEESVPSIGKGFDEILGAFAARLDHARAAANLPVGGNAFSARAAFPGG